MTIEPKVTLSIIFTNFVLNENKQLIPITDISQMPFATKFEAAKYRDSILRNGLRLENPEQGLTVFIPARHILKIELVELDKFNNWKTNQSTDEISETAGIAV